MSQAQQIKISDKIQGVIEKEFDNKVIGRRELTLKLYHIGTGTPSRNEIKKAISELLNTKEDLIVVRKVFTSYGAGISTARVHVYTNKETLEKYEPKHLLTRGTSTKKEGEQGGEKGSK